MSIIGVLLIACLAYLYFFVMKNEEQVEKDINLMSKQIIHKYLMTTKI